MPVITNFPYHIDAGSDQSVAMFVSRTIEECVDNGKVSTIGVNAFRLCTSLSLASFPACATVGSSAFYSCTSLESLYLMGSSIAVLSANAFTYTPMSSSTYLGHYGSIYVPSSLLSSYKTATNWSAYSDRLVGL